MRILIVEDEARVARQIAAALTEAGHDPAIVSDGPAALRSVAEASPDLIVLDVGLPQMTGFEVCHQIREKSSTPVILLTALNDEENIIQGFRLGADDYVTKPFSVKVLLHRVKVLLRRQASPESSGLGSTSGASKVPSFPLPFSRATTFR